MLTAWPILSAPRRSCSVALFVKTERRFRRCHSRRVAFSVRHALNTRRVVQGLARLLRRHSHCKPSQAEQNRIDSALKTNLVMKWMRSHCTTNRTGPSLTEHVYWLMFVNHNAAALFLWKILSLTRPLVLGSQSSWRYKTKLKLMCGWPCIVIQCG